MPKLLCLVCGTQQRLAITVVITFNNRRMVNVTTKRGCGCHLENISAFLKHLLACFPDLLMRRSLFTNMKLKFPISHSKPESDVLVIATRIPSLPKEGLLPFPIPVARETPPCLATMRLAMQSGTLVPAAKKVIPMMTSGIPSV